MATAKKDKKTIATDDVGSLAALFETMLRRNLVRITRPESVREWLEMKVRHWRKYQGDGMSITTLNRWTEEFDDEVNGKSSKNNTPSSSQKEYFARQPPRSGKRFPD